MATSELNTRDSYLRKSFFEQTLEHHKRNSPVQTDGRKNKRSYKSALSASDWKFSVKFKVDGPWLMDHEVLKLER